ncbi:uncharacterized protein LOC124454659 [Xenia sp. Carnegie-2017]|uniref:uncharacterized protein LOC124454659 n=1 Tax=Xenia sp. Carnegie-2017 TaxID=2897299 RepID=UPI001F046987|nr:uncharacterized protein LOC124454659 [Xenia sp. Carnegie-2017]
MPLEKFVSSLFDLLMNKVRDDASDMLRYGDIADERFRNLIIRDLQDIKKKVESLSKKDLVVSCEYLEQGFLLLSKCFVRIKKNELKQSNDKYDNERLVAACDAITEIKQFIQNCDKLETGSTNFKDAKDRFKNSREKANEAFSNEGLTLMDRIHAVKIMIVAQILERFETLDDAIDLCILYMKKLHQLKEVRKMFSVQIGGGLRSMIAESQRKEIIKSVMILNYNLNQFIMSINNSFRDAKTWPSIELQHGSEFNPILNWYKIFTPLSWNEMLITSPHELICAYPSLSTKHYSVNSRGEIIACYYDKIEVLKNDDVKIIEGIFRVDRILACTLDEHDSLYILGKSMFVPVEALKNLPLPYLDQYTLIIFDKHLSLTNNKNISNSIETAPLKRFLDLIPILRFQALNHYLVLLGNFFLSSKVIVFDSNGVLQNKFTLPVRMHALTLSNNNEILLGVENKIFIYSMEGSLISTLSLRVKILDLTFHMGFAIILIFDSSGGLSVCDGTGTIQCQPNANPVLTNVYYSKYQIVSHG